MWNVETSYFRLKDFRQVNRKAHCGRCESKMREKANVSL